MEDCNDCGRTHSAGYCSQPPRFVEQPRKVHLHHDNAGATFGPKKQPFANTLCRMNSTSPQTRITMNPDEVTCKICRKDARFKAFTAGRDTALELTTVLTTPSKPVLRTRYRRNWRGQLILQVEYSYNNADPRDPRDLGQTFMRWRDATLEDLGLGVV